ncbi:MAG: EpsI family protein [Rhodocyclaceae bacterium]|nr:MAG: EpsI family protein [Rhodocyclaceae bacterium]
MISSRTAVVLAALMFATSLGAVVVRPDTKAADKGPAISLETMVPHRLGNWREEPQQFAQVVNPQTKELLDKLYSQILTRTYVNDDGYRVMVSIAYGSDQRDELQAHKPEVCYPAQGFTLHSNEPGMLPTEFGEIPVRRLFTSMGPRQEPVTYWFTVGDKAIESKFYKRLVELRYGLTGQIPDGLLFRVSSIDPDPARAYRAHALFVNQLLEAIPESSRQRLSGLGRS